MPMFPRFAGAAVCVLACLAGRAGAHTADAPVLREKEVQTFTIQADGSYTEVAEVVLLVRQQSAVASAAQQTMVYNSTNGSAEVVSAYTLKPDGSKLAVGADSIKHQQERSSVEAPQYVGRSQMTIIFPQVAAGDRLVYSTRTERRAALFAGQFSDFTPVGGRARGALTLIYDLPASMPLRDDNRGFIASHAPALPGRQRLRWDLVATPATYTEADAVDLADFNPRLFVTTFASHAALGRAYEDAARAASALTPALTQLAAAQVAGKNGARAAAVALAQWVRDNIRPVPVHIASADRLAPNSAAQVLANRYGDSRDQVALLRALLDAAGIGNSAALVNAERSYRLPAVAAIDVLDRAVVYVPSLELYLDPSRRAILPGFLPAELLDKPALLTASGAIGHTPRTQPVSTRADTDFAVAADGSAAFATTVVFDGANAEEERAFARGFDASGRATRVQQILQQLGQSGGGDWDPGDTDSAGSPYRMRYSGRSDDLAPLPGPVGIVAASGLFPHLANTVAALAREGARHLDFVCASGQLEEKARYRFADGVRIIAVPAPVALHDGVIDYRASYERAGNEVRVARSLRVRHPGGVCRADEFARMQQSIALMQHDLKSQLIIEAK